jgi:hypothetical protein
MSNVFQANLAKLRGEFDALCVKAGLHQGVPYLDDAVVDELDNYYEAWANGVAYDLKDEEVHDIAYALVHRVYTPDIPGDDPVVDDLWAAAKAMLDA